MKWLSVVSALLLFVNVSVSYEQKLDTVGDARFWTFSGNYFYSPSVDDIEGFFPTLTPIHSRLTSAREKPLEANPGIWFTKHISGRRNAFRLSYRTTHALMVQGWIKFLSDPTVAVVVKAGSSNRHLGSFYSDGKSWCDAVFNVGYESSIFVDVETPERNDYFLLDRITMGLSQNLSQLRGRKLNPCLLRTPSSRAGQEGSETGEDLEENKRTGTGRMNPGGSELEGRQRGARPNLSTSTTTPEDADATLDELEKFLEESRPVSTSTVTSTTSTKRGRGRVNRKAEERDGRGRRASATTTDSHSDPDSLPLHPIHTQLTRNINGANSTGNDALDSDPNVDCNCSCSCSKRST